MNKNIIISFLPAYKTHCINANVIGQHSAHLYHCGDCTQEESYSSSRRKITGTKVMKKKVTFYSVKESDKGKI